jgi:hypothetical protein
VGVEFAVEVSPPFNVDLALSLVPARLSLVILTPPVLVRGKRLPALAELEEPELEVVVAVADDVVGVLVAHPAVAPVISCTERGGTTEDPPARTKPLISRVLSPEFPSRLVGLNCPGVNDPAMANAEALPNGSRLEDVKGSTFLRSKYELRASRRCLGVPFRSSIGMLWLLSRLGGMGGGVIVLAFELDLRIPGLSLAPSKLLRDPLSHILTNSDAISRTRMAGSALLRRWMAS